MQAMTAADSILKMRSDLDEPQTGEIYAMSGKAKGDDGKITNFADW